MKSSSQFDLSEEIDKIKKNHFQFLQNLKQIKFPSKEKFIQSDYLKNLKLLAPWLSIKNPAESKSFSEHSIKGKQNNNAIKNESIDELLDRINSNPEQKLLILQEFLIHIAEISDQDRSVLLENFKILDNKSLKKELENILQTFH